MSNPALKKDPSSPFKSSRRSIIYDKVHPSDFLRLNLTFCCEQCSHFDSETQTCTIGYEASLHMRDTQIKMYELSGRVAFCRFSEID